MSDGRDRGDMLRAYSPCSRLEMEIALPDAFFYGDILGQKRHGNFVLSIFDINRCIQLIEVNESRRIVRDYLSRFTIYSMITFMVNVDRIVICS